MKPGEGRELSQGTLDAMRHILTCPPKRLFSFKLDVPSQKKMSDVCEAFLLTQLERGFGTLDFYKQLSALQP